MIRYLLHCGSTPYPLSLHDCIINIVIVRSSQVIDFNVVNNSATGTHRATSDRLQKCTNKLPTT